MIAFFGSEKMINSKGVTIYIFVQVRKGIVAFDVVESADSTGAVEAFVGGMLSILALDTNLFEVCFLLFLFLLSVIHFRDS